MNIEVRIDDMRTKLLLFSLLRSFEHFKAIVLYGKEDIVSLEEVQAALRTNELIELNDLIVDDGGKCLNVPIGRGESRGNCTK